MKKVIFTFLGACLMGFSTFAQSGVAINTTGTPADPSSILDVSSTNAGVLIPRITGAQRNAIPSPANGLLIVNTTSNCLEIFLNPMWQSIFCGCNPPSAPATGTHVPASTQIVWNWNTVSGATGYKYNTINDYNTAVDNGINTSYTQTGLTCGTSCSLYVWAYGSCGNSAVLTLTQTTSACFNCGTTVTVNHVAGSISPVDKTVNYGTVTSNVTGQNKCWITQNLGSDIQATAANDATEAASGWYWQFNRKQGYQYTTVRTPNTTWITSISENSDWLQVNDPCELLLGAGWRIPTATEWTNADVNNGWSNYNQTYASDLKLHVAGFFFNDGIFNYRGSIVGYWSSTQLSNTNAHRLYIDSGFSMMVDNAKSFGFTLRCIKD